MKQVDYSFAFGYPHRLTLSRPQSGNKTLADLNDDHLLVSWSYGSLMEKIPNTWDSPRIDWLSQLSFYINESRVTGLRGKRFDSGAPGLIITGYSDKLGITLKGIAARHGDVFKVSFANEGNVPLCCDFICEHKNGWVISNPAWIDGRNPNTLMTMQYERADRLLYIGCGADRYPVDMSINHDGEPVVPLNQQVGETGNPAKTLTMNFMVEPGKERTGWLVRPYQSYEPDIKRLESINWEQEMTDAEQEWIDLLAKGAQPIIPDEGMAKAFRSCLADQFVMREPLRGGYMGMCPGTELYRSVNPVEATVAVMLFDRLGYKREAAEEMPLHLEAQGADGNWNDPEGWGHHMWFGSGFKAMMVMEHYKLTCDTVFLQSAYERMKRSSIWQQAMRETTKINPKSPLHGLMPRGMGDCGLTNKGDYFGVFYPHNCMAVLADRLAWEAAVILKKTEDIPLLKDIYETAAADLVNSLRKGAIQEDGYIRIPGMAGQRDASSYGALYSFHPAHLLKKDDPLITGTLRHMERRKSTGGQPIGTGWMQDGIWVAMSLDNLAQTYLAMQDGDSASTYLYSSVNHASGFCTWCEERGAEPGTNVKSGDLQHLWTPLSVCHYVRDALVTEQPDGLHLALGIPRYWLGLGMSVGIQNAPVYGGNITYMIKRETNNSRMTIVMSIDDALKEKDIIIHLRIPERGTAFRINEVRGGHAELKNEKLRFVPGNTDCFIDISIYAALK